MTKFEITNGKCVKEYKDGKAVKYAVGDVVEFDTLPSSLTGKARELPPEPAKPAKKADK